MHLRQDMKPTYYVFFYRNGQLRKAPANGYEATTAQSPLFEFDIWGTLADEDNARHQAETWLSQQQ